MIASNVVARSVSRVVRLVILLACVTTCVHPLDSAAQSPVAAGAGRKIATFNGKLQGVTRAGIAIVGDDGTEYLVSPPAQPTKLLLQAEADSTFLSPGQLIRLRADFNAAGVAIAPVDRIELIPPMPIRALERTERNRYEPGVHPVDRHAKPGTPGKYYVIGQMRGSNGNAIAVQAGKVPLQLPIAPELKWTVMDHSMNLAQEGDPVSVEGFYEESQPTRIQGQRIVVKPTRVFAAAAAEAGPRRRPGGEAKADRGKGDRDVRDRDKPQPADEAANDDAAKDEAANDDAKAAAE